MISVPLESERDDAKRWAEEFQVAFPVLFDPQRKVAQAYSVSAIPYNVAIDRDGKVADIVVGADTDGLEAVAKKLAKKE